MDFIIPPANLEKNSTDKKERAKGVVTIPFQSGGNQVDNKKFLQNFFQFMWDFDLLNSGNVDCLVNSASNEELKINTVNGNGLLQKNNFSGEVLDRCYQGMFVRLGNDEYCISREIQDNERWIMAKWLFNKAGFSSDDIKEFNRTYEDSMNKKNVQTPAQGKVERNSSGTNASNERKKGGTNLIIYGAPGTGKSYYVENEIGLEKDKITRVVFHPEYTYFDFVGQYRPCPVYVKNTERKFVALGEAQDSSIGEPFIDYRFVAGPFTDVLVKAWKDKENMYTLLIEELNRADAAAVFGDVFQLLDRKDGESEYGIVPSAEWSAYLKKEGVLPEYGKIRIPSNMNIIATMNSADQGVHVLDTAFKRRWDYKFMSIETNDRSIASELNIPVYYTKDANVWNICTWKNLLDVINEKLIGTVGIAEDRLVGPFFVKPEIVKNEKGKYAIEKILFYLWDDVLRNNDRDSFFDNDLKTMSQLYKAFEAGKDVMGIKDKLNLKPEPQDNENTQVEQAENQGETSAENNTGNNGQAQ